jgi:hypothetical protein
MPRAPRTTTLATRLQPASAPTVSPVRARSTSLAILAKVPHLFQNSVEKDDAATLQLLLLADLAQKIKIAKGLSLAYRSIAVLWADVGVKERFVTRTTEQPRVLPKPVFLASPSFPWMPYPLSDSLLTFRNVLCPPLRGTRAQSGREQPRKTTTCQTTHLWGTLSWKPRSLSRRPLPIQGTSFTSNLAVGEHRS